MKEKLVVVSENENWCGEWVRIETEAEMEDVGYVGDWLEWIFDHNFDKCPLEILHVLQLFDVRELVADIDGFRTRFMKSRA